MVQEQKDFEKNHSKKMIAPIIIASILVIYYCIFIVLCFMLHIPLVIKFLMVIIPLALASVVIYVLVERIKEIRSGVEDDLSKY